MNPQNDQKNAQVGMPLTDQNDRRVVVPPRNQASAQQAAADVIRGQLDNIYGGGSGEDTPHTTPVDTSQPATAEPKLQPIQLSQPENHQPDQGGGSSSHGLQTAPPAKEPEPQTQPTPQPEQPLSTYQRTMDTNIVHRQPTKDQWDQYHSAWQKYYQMYYERQNLAKAYADSRQTAPIQPQAAIGSQNQASAEASVSQQQAMRELRSTIRQKVADSATKVKKSRHFIPIVAGLVVLLLFVFLQYNRVIFGAVAAYTTPGNIEPQNIIVDPTVDVEVGPEPRMIIPKINVDAPVVYGIGPDHNSQMAAMEKGIAHFSIPGANATPGQVGNSVFAAHSSNDVFARGDYKFIFAQNEKLVEGDIIYMNFEGKRYTYSVTSKEVVMPTEVSKVQLDTDKPMLTLISCVPLGTAEKRLLIFAEQVSPDPAQAEAAADSSIAPEAASIPGRPAPTLLERVFGAR